MLSHLGKRSPKKFFHPEMRPPFVKCRPHPVVRAERASKERTAVAQDEEGTSKERRFF
jgi:hypothetical protein